MLEPTEYVDGVPCPHCRGSEYADKEGRCFMVVGGNPNQFCATGGCICWGGPSYECEACWLEGK